jgi:transcriptional regulator with XRE-family HTH domain
MGEASYFGRRLRELRAAAGLTLARLAERSGLHPQAIVKLERAEREPAWSTVIALAEALGVGCQAFLEPPAAEPPEVRRGRPPKALPAPAPNGTETKPARGRNRKEK